MSFLEILKYSILILIGFFVVGFLIYTFSKIQMTAWIKTMRQENIIIKQIKPKKEESTNGKEKD